MAGSKPTRTERDRARERESGGAAAAAAKAPAKGADRSRSRSRTPSRPSLAPVPARTSRAQPAGNALAREAIPALASALAQTPVTFVTEPPALGVITGQSTVHHDEKHGKPGVGVRQKFGELREALADGWEIVQPIFARPLWSVSDDSITAFNFVLRRECTTRLVTVPAGRTVQRFIRDRQLIVDYRN